MKPVVRIRKRAVPLVELADEILRIGDLARVGSGRSAARLFVAEILYATAAAIQGNVWPPKAGEFVRAGPSRLRVGDPVLLSRLRKVASKALRDKTRPMGYSLGMMLGLLIKTKTAFGAELVSMVRGAKDRPLDEAAKGIAIALAYCDRRIGLLQKFKGESDAQMLTVDGHDLAEFLEKRLLESWKKLPLSGDAEADAQRILEDLDVPNKAARNAIYAGEDNRIAYSVRGKPKGKPVSRNG